jgi:hypothetical protein
MSGKLSEMPPAPKTAALAILLFEPVNMRHSLEAGYYDMISLDIFQSSG